MKNFSVCMATYNGGKYIKKQLDSILDQLGSDDELIIVDDCSLDNTVDLINSVCDERIVLYINNVNRGVVYSFNKAIEKSSGTYVLLADQDDIWVPSRMSLMGDAIKFKKILLLSSNISSIDIDGNIIESLYTKLESRDSKRYFFNIIGIFMGRRKASYYGCAMIFSRKIIDVILPFPKYIESHDLWIALAANIMRSNAHIEDITLLHTLHGNNLSLSNRSFIRIVYSRFINLISIVHILYRLLKLNFR